MNTSTTPKSKNAAHVLNIGEVLRRAGVVTQAEIDAAVVVAAAQGLRLGEALVAVGACTEGDVERALDRQTRMRGTNSEAVRVYRDLVADAAEATSVIARRTACS